MPVFSLDNGRLRPARPTLTHSEDIVREALIAVRDQVVELLYQPLFPVAWLTETSRGNIGERHTSLVALDSAGKTVTVDVVQQLNSAGLMASLARAARHEEIARGKLAGLYPRGVAAFRRDWQEFLDSCPTGVVDHPRLVIMAVEIDDDVKTALDALVGASLDVYRIDLHESRNGLLVSLEQVRPHEATFLALGQASSRSEIAPPPPASSESESEATGAITGALSSSESASVETAESPDEYGSWNRSETEASFVSPAHIERDGVSEVDEAAFETDGESRDATGDNHVAAGDAKDASDGHVGDYGRVGDEEEAPSSEQERDEALGEAGDQVVEHGIDPDPEEEEFENEFAGLVGSEDKQDPSDEDFSHIEESFDEEFRQVGFTPDGTDVASAASAPDEDWLNQPKGDETVEFEADQVEWPERVTELQSVVRRHGSQTLTFKSLRRRVNASAQLTEEGTIILENGDTFTDPDQAASAVAGRQMDGWKNWRTSEGHRLGDLRN